MVTYRIVTVSFSILDLASSPDAEEDFLRTIGEIKKKMIDTKFDSKTKSRVLVFKNLTTNEIQKLRRNSKDIISMDAQVSVRTVKDGGKKIGKRKYIQSVVERL